MRSIWIEPIHHQNDLARIEDLITMQEELSRLLNILASLGIVNRDPDIAIGIKFIQIQYGLLDGIHRTTEITAIELDLPLSSATALHTKMLNLMRNLRGTVSDEVSNEFKSEQ